MLDVWPSEHSRELVADWIRQHAEFRSTSVHDCALELFETLVIYREQKLVAASDVTTLPEHEEELRQASVALELGEVLFDDELPGI